MVCRWTCELKSYNTNKAFGCNIYKLYNCVQRRCTEAAIRVGPNTNLNIDTPHGLSRNLKTQQSKNPQFKKSQINSRQKYSKRTQGKNKDPRATGGLVATGPPPQVKKIKKAHVRMGYRSEIRVWIGRGGEAASSEPAPRTSFTSLVFGPHVVESPEILAVYRIFVKAQKSLPNSEKTLVLLGGSAHC